MNRATPLTFKKSSKLITAIAMVGLLSNFALAQPAPPPPGDNGPAEVGPPPRPEAEPAGDPVPLTGTVKYFNLGPNGQFESLMLDVGGKLSQVNFPPHAADAVTKSIAAGESVSLTAGQRKTEADHPIYELATLTGKDGKTMTVPRPGEEKLAHVDGTVTHLNYGRDGRVNGAVIDDKTFVHIGPAGVDQLKLAEGQKLSVDGKEKPAAGALAVFDADKINGVEIPHPRPREGGPRGGPDNGPESGPRQRPAGDGAKAPKP